MLMLHQNSDRYANRSEGPFPLRPKKLSWRRICIALLLILLPCFIYGPHVRLDHLWYLDDHALIDPVFLAHSWADYKNAPILDVAPLRDLSYGLDRAFFQWTGVTIFHLHNALLWGLIVYLIYLILANFFFDAAKLKTNPPCHHMALLVALLVLVHPMFSLDIFWAAARKHLLAVCFTLLNTYYWCHYHQTWPYARLPDLSKKFIARTAFLYLAALNAWPIVILWPLWALTCRWFIWREKISLKKNVREILAQDKLITLCLLLIALSMAGLNLHYYPHSGPHGKLHGVSWASLAAFGQYFFNFIWPFKIAIGYPMATRESLLGLSLGLFFGYLTFKVMPRRWWFTWMLYYFCSLAVVTLNLSHIYVSDTYHTGGGWILLASGAYLVLATGQALASKGSTNPCLARLRAWRLPAILTVGLILFLGTYDFLQQKNWRTDFLAYQTSVRHQPDDPSNNEFFLLNWLHPTREDHFTCSPIIARLIHWTNLREGKFDPPQMPLLLIMWYLEKIKTSTEPLAVKIACLDALPHLPQVPLTKALLYLRQSQLSLAQKQLADLAKIRLSPVDAPELKRLNLIYQHKLRPSPARRKRNHP